MICECYINFWIQANLHFHYLYEKPTCADTGSFVRGGPTLTFLFFNFFIYFFYLMRRFKYHYKWAIISPPTKRHLNGISLACWWWPKIGCWLGRFVIFQGIRNVQTLYFCDFSGGVEGGGWGGGGGAHILSLLWIWAWPKTALFEVDQFYTPQEPAFPLHHPAVDVSVIGSSAVSKILHAPCRPGL